MTTTSLFVELVIIGIGAFLWVFLILSGVIGYSWIPFEKIAPLRELIVLAALLPVLSITYVFGIVVDRIADSAFSVWDKKLRDKYFIESTDYQQARTIIYDQSQSLRDWFQYGRSRLRVCRGWAINAVLCVFGLNIFIWSQQLEGVPKWRITWIGSLFLILLTIGAIRGWQKLTESEYKRLSSEYAAAKNRQFAPITQER